MFKLKEIRIESGLTRAELARILKINQGTLANYENCTREASYDLLIAFADFFDISIDELLGREKRPSSIMAECARPLSRVEKDLISSLRKLSANEFNTIYDLVNMLNKKNND